MTPSDDTKVLEAARAGADLVGVTPGSDMRIFVVQGAIAAINEYRARSGGVGVKALEWEGPDMFGALYTRGNVGDQYVIKERNGNGFWLTVIGKYFPVRDEAKAAAQADYERRVRSALAPEPAEREATTRKIYLASRYSRFPEMQKVRTDLEAAGYIVTSRWINGGHELTKEGSTEAHEAERVRYAQEDFADLLAADCVISFTEIPRETKTRGGRHVEHGMALALGKRVIVIGYRENVFHCLPQCEFFTTWADALASLSTPGQGGRAGEAPAPRRAPGTAL